MNKRRIFQVRVLLVTGTLLTVIGGCQPQSMPSAYRYTIVADSNPASPGFTPYQADTFSCSGIGETQIEYILPPDNYTVDLSRCSISSDKVSLVLSPWGVPEACAGPTPIRVSYFQPFMVYQFPAEIGNGGVWWETMMNGISVPILDPNQVDVISVNAVLELFHLEQGRVIYSRGLILALSKDIRDGLLTDPVSAISEFTFQAAKGLTAEYPDLFPIALPNSNPSPYMPSENDIWPTASSTTAGVPDSGYLSPPDGQIWAPPGTSPTPEPTSTPTS